MNFKRYKFLLKRIKYIYKRIWNKNAVFHLFYIWLMEKEKRIYNRIKAHLALKQVRNKMLAQHLEVSEQTVSKWCTNFSQPSIPELYAIAEYLDLNVCELLEPNRAKREYPV